MDFISNIGGDNPPINHPEPTQTASAVPPPPPHPPSTGDACTFNREGARTDRLVDALVKIVGKCRLSAVSKTAAGDKLVIPVAPDFDVRACAIAHVTGVPIDVRMMTKSGSFVGKRNVFGFYTAYHLDGETWTQVLVLDIDVVGKDGSHKRGLSADKARTVIAVLMASLREGGLSPVLVRSPGGSGWHILVLFAEPVPAEFARLIGDLAKADAGIEGEDAVEVFPKSGRVRADGFGYAITLPCVGRPFGIGGGMVQQADGSPSLDPASLLVSSQQDVVGRMLGIYAPVMVRQAAMAAKAEVVRQFKNIRFSRSNSAPWVPLDDIAHQLGEVVDDEVSEPGIIKLKCPKHGGASLHVHADAEEGRSWWRCHACNASSGGLLAAETLVRWLTSCGAKDATATLRGLAAGLKGGAL